MTTPPKVSVCIPTYNQEAYIEECVTSVLHQQTNFDFEIIIGEDASTDNTRAILQRLHEQNPGRLTLILHERNVGGCRNYRHIHDSARGQYIAHLDGDDYALPGKLQAQADYLDRHPECAVVWHRMRLLDAVTGTLSDDAPLPRFLAGPATQADLLEIGSIAAHSSKMYRASAAPMSFPDGDFLDYYVDVETLNHGHGCYLKDFYGVYRRGIGVTTQKSKVKLLKLKHLGAFYRRYPQFQDHISSLALRLFLADVAFLNRDKTLRDTFLLAVRTFRFGGLFRYLRAKLAQYRA